MDAMDGLTPIPIPTRRVKRVGSEFFNFLFLWPMYGLWLWPVEIGDEFEMR